MTAVRPSRNLWSAGTTAAVLLLAGALATQPMTSAFTTATSTTGSARAGYYAFDRAAINTIAGTGAAGFNGDDQPAVGAQVNNPAGLAIDSTGNLLVADLDNHRVRRISPTGVITTIAGTGAPGFAGDGGPATAAQLNRPRAMSVTGSGEIYIADGANHRIRKISSGGTISTVAGNGTAGYGGDGGPATAAALFNPRGVTLCPDGTLYIADTDNHRIRAVDATGTIRTASGTGTGTYSGDGGPATSAALNAPYQLACAPDGRLYLTDTGNHRIRMIRPDGMISTVAGTGTGGYSGDGGPAVQAQIGDPQALALDPAGNLYIAERYNNRIRKITPDGIITTVVGTGTATSTGDGGPAASATVNGPRGLAATLTQLYLSEVNGQRIRRVR